MAITRRQFVTTLGALAAAMGVGQADISKITEAFAHDADYNGLAANNWANKPKVIWVHGAECTGCSTSLLSLFEDVRGKAIRGASTTTLAALDLAVGGDGSGLDVLGPAGKAALSLPSGEPAGHPFGHRTLWENSLDVDSGANSSTPYIANIADVLIDFIDLQYHETVMGMGGDLAAKWLLDNMGDGTPSSGSANPFVLVVEGAVQDKDNGGYWNVTGAAPWCSVGKSNAGTELSFDDVVAKLAQQTNCLAVISIGQCACFGGYPACQSPVLKKDTNGVAHGASMTGALGVADFLALNGGSGVAAKVINVPGCPANPWWFVLTVVAWMVDFQNPSRPLGILEALPSNAPAATAIDGQRRLKKVFGTPLHGPACPRYQNFLDGVFATRPGDPGCLQLIGCKGPSTNSLCNVHGWNSMQPQNDSTWEGSLQAASSKAGSGGACMMAGAPCMGCAEKGYPDAFVPFVVR